jgi:hypothetical protein
LPHKDTEPSPRHPTGAVTPQVADVVVLVVRGEVGFDLLAVLV